MSKFRFIFYFARRMKASETQASSQKTIFTSFFLAMNVIIRFITFCVVSITYNKTVCFTLFPLSLQAAIFTYSSQNSLRMIKVLSTEKNDEKCTEISFERVLIFALKSWSHGFNQYFSQFLIVGIGIWILMMY